MPAREEFSKRPIAVMFAIACLITASIAWFSYQTGRALSASAEQSNISSDVHDTTIELLSAMDDAETGQRGFLITGRDEYLAPYNKALEALPRVFEKLNLATAERPDQAQRVAELRPSVDAKLKELAATIDLRRNLGFDAARAAVETDRGRHLMDDIRRQIAVIRNTANARAVEYAAAADANAQRLRSIGTIGSLVVLGFLGLSAWIIFRSLRHREDLYLRAARSAEHLRVTLDSIGDAVIATDPQKRITFINPIARQLTGWSEAEALGKPIQDVFRIVNEATRAVVENPLDKALATGVVVGLANHTILISRNGDEIPIDDSGAPIQTAETGVVGAILVFRDISERREAEKQLQTLNEHLKEFVDGAAHDLRSPLRSVRSMAQLMQRRFPAELGQDGVQFLDIIGGGVRRMEALLDALLNYAQAGYFDLSEDPRAPLQNSLQTALDNLRADIDDTKTHVTTGSQAILPVHDAHLVQLLQNLIGNAIKYRGSDTPRVHIECTMTSDGWRVDVTDNGIGVDPEYREIIFKPFKRLHGEDMPGSGIGLSICEKIVWGYGGKIWVDSEPGKGSTFSFTIPHRHAHNGTSAAS